MVGDFGSGLTQSLTFYCGKPEAVLGKMLVGNGRPSGRLPSLKIWKISGKKQRRYRGPKLGFRIWYITYAIFSVEDARSLQRKQEAQLSPRDRAMRRLNWNLANCHATVQKLLIRQVLTKSMTWRWRFSRRQCVIDNVHSTMTRSSRLPLSQVS